MSRLSVFASLVMLTSMVLSAAVLPARRVDAATISSCSTDLPQTFGRGTYTTASNVAAGTYQVWSRVGLASGSGNASYLLSIGGSGAAANHYCNQTVSVAATAPSGGNISWVWVKSNPFTWSGSAPITFEFAGNKDGVGLDCIVLRADTVDLANSGVQGCDSSFGSTGGTTSTAGTTTAGTGCAKYDIDGNGSINILDALNLLNNRNSGNTAKYDIDGNGSINILDALNLLNNRNCQ